MENSTEALQARIDALSISEATPSSDTTVVGIGSLSGRALMALGELTLRGLEAVNLRMKLRTISSHLAQDGRADVPDEVYDVLLELQRAGLYSDSIRFAAWDQIFREMELGHTEGLIHGLFRWPWVEVEIFIQQLGLSRSRLWTTYPGSAVDRPIRSYGIVSKPETLRITESFRDILKATLLHFQDTLSLEQLVVVEDADVDSIILTLALNELDIILKSVLRRPIMEIQFFIRRILLSRLACSGSPQQTEDISDVLIVLSAIWRHDPKLIGATLTLEDMVAVLPDALILPNGEDISFIDPVYHPLLNVAQNICNSVDFDDLVFMFDMVAEPAILMLPEESQVMQGLLVALQTRTPAQIRFCIHSLILSRLPTWSQHSEKLQIRMAENLVHIFWVMRTHAPHGIQDILSFDRMMSIIPQSLLEGPNYPILPAIWRHSANMDDLRLLSPFLDAQSYPVILTSKDGVNMLIRVLFEGAEKAEIHKEFQRYIFSKIQTTQIKRHDRNYRGVAENVVELAIEIWRRDPSYVDTFIPPDWITTVYSTAVRDPTRQIFQVILRLSRSPENRRVVSPLLQIPISAETTGEITAKLSTCTSPQIALYLHQLILAKAVQWSEHVEAEGVIEDIMTIVFHIWQHDPVVVDALLSRIDSEAKTSTLTSAANTYSGIVRNIGQCVIIALLDGLRARDELRSLLPSLKTQRAPVILFVSSKRFRAIADMFGQDGMQAGLVDLVLPKLTACSHQPLIVRQRIVKNLLDVFSEYPPHAQTQTPMEVDLGWIVAALVSDSVLPPERTMSQLMTLATKCGLLAVDCPSTMPWSQTTADDAVINLLRTSRWIIQDMKQPVRSSTGRILTRSDVEANVWISLCFVIYHLCETESVYLKEEHHCVILKLTRTTICEEVRRAAWDLILLHLERGDVRYLIAALLRLPDSQSQDILKQLRVAKLAQWAMYPGSSTKRKASPRRTRAVENQNFDLPRKIIAREHLGHTTESFLQLLLAVLHDKPAIIHASLSWEAFLDCVGTNGRPSLTLGKSSQVLNEITVCNTTAPPTEILCCTLFLQTGGQANDTRLLPPQTVSLELSEALLGFAVSAVFISTTLLSARQSMSLAVEYMKMALDVKEKLNIRPTGPEAMQSYFVAGLTTADWLIRNCRELVSMLDCLITVYAWGIRHSDARYDIPESLIAHFAQPGPKSTSEVLGFGEKWANGSLVDTWVMLYILEYVTLNGNGVGLGQLHWIRLLMTLTPSHPLSERAYNVLLCCAASSEEQWEPLLQALQLESSAAAVKSLMLQFRSWHISSTNLARRLYIRAKILGFTVANPVNRLVLLLREAACIGPSVQKGLKRSQATALVVLKTVQTCSFDDVGWPTQEERDMRDKACRELIVLAE